MKFSEIKPKIKNLGAYKTLAEIKGDGLRLAYNRADDSYWLIEGEFLGLTASEREAVYEAVADLVRRRLEKARSV